MQQLQVIAMRIRALREDLNLSISEVAARAGISAAELSTYEKGETDFSFSHLFNIAEALSVDISDLLTGESPKLKGYVLTRAGTGLMFDRRKQYHYQHLAYNFKDKKAEPFVVTVERDQPDVIKEAHEHDGQEFDFVMSGVLRLELGGNELYLREGDSIYYDSNLPHVMYAPDGDCRFLAVVIK